LVGRDNEPAKDEEWKRLEPSELYLARGDPVPPGRPFFQGDVFREAVVPVIEKRPDGDLYTRLDTRTVMLMPHPCSCYRGDDLRNRLTVATVFPIAADKKITSVEWRTLDYFPLPEVRHGQDGIANIGELATVPTEVLVPERRIACLSLAGVAWLHKRILKYMTRRRWLITNLQAELLAQWDDVEIWQAWMRVRGSPQGYEQWKRTVVNIAGIGEVEPRRVIPGRTAQLIAHLEGGPAPE
jgi:hypothetical protein